MLIAISKYAINLIKRLFISKEIMLSQYIVNEQR